MEGPITAVEASTAELKASNETQFASNKAIKDHTIHTMMMTIKDKLGHSNATPDAVVTGPETKALLSLSQLLSLQPQVVTLVSG